MNCKKTVAAGVGLLMLFQGMLTPRAVQASFAFQAAASVGWVLALGFAGGSLTAVTLHHFIELKNASTRKKVLRIAAAILTGLGALILLDADEAGAGVQLASLSAEEAKRIGLSEAEWSAYERERFEIRALSEQVVVDAERAVGSEDPTRLIAEIRANWDRDSEWLLSAEARAAAHKIARSAMR